MQAFMQKSFIIIILMASLLIIASFINKARRSELVLQMMMNVSRNLDKIETGLNVMNSETELAKKRFRKLIGLHRERILNCIFYQRNKLNERKIEIPNSNDATRSTDIIEN